MSFAASLLLAVAAVPGVAQEVRYVEPAILGIPQRELANLAGGIIDMRGMAGQMSVQIEAARARYWQSFPDGPDFAAAQKEFNSLLWQKDLLYFIFPVEENKSTEGIIRVLKLLAGKIDGGIRPSAYFEFEQWASAVKWHLAGNHPEDVLVLVLNPVRLIPALIDSLPQMAAYMRARDWAEFEASGIDLTKYIDPKAYALHLIEDNLVGWDPEYSPRQPDYLDQANKLYAIMVDFAGEPAVRTAAATVLAAKKNGDGNLVEPVKISLPTDGVQRTVVPFAWFEAAVLNSNTRAYAHALLLGGRGVGMDYYHAWTISSKKYEDLVKQYGEPAVAAAANRVKALPVTAAGVVPGGSPDWPGDQKPPYWFKKLLAKADTKLPDGVIRKFDAANFTKEDADAMGSQVTLRGTVDRVKVDKSPGLVRSTVVFKDVKGMAVEIFSMDAYLLRGLDGKTVEFTGHAGIYPHVTMQIYRESEVRIVDPSSP